MILFYLKDLPYNVIASWGDPVGDSRYGFNNDHIGLVETDKDEAYLVINHECVDFDNFKTYLETFPNVMNYKTKYFFSPK